MTETSDYRMIALDLDGTLLDPQARVRPRLKQAVHQLVSCGWTVCFATGRSYLESQPVLEQVDHYDLGVFIGGAVLVDTRNGATLFQQKMQPVLAKEISGQLENLGHAVLALQDSSAAGADYYATAGVALNAATTHWMQHFNARVTRIGSLGNFDHAHTIRLGIVGSTGQTSQAQQLLKERFGSNVLVHSLRVSSDVEVLECFDPSVNKWEGIRRIARQRDIMESQIITVVMIQMIRS